MSGMGGPPPHGQLPPQGGQIPPGMGRGYGPGGPSNEPWNAYGAQQPPHGQQQQQQPHQQPPPQQQFYSQMPQQQLPPPQQHQQPPMGMYQGQGQGMPPQQQQPTLPQQPQYPMGMGQQLQQSLQNPHPQQSLQNPQQQQSISGQARAPPQGYNSPAPMGSVGSTAPASQQQQPAQPQQQPAQQQEIKFRNELQMYPEQILNNLATYDVAQLCTIGKEIVNELNAKTSTFCQLMKVISEKRPSNQQYAYINYLMEYCELLLKKLYEIRLRIEKAAPGIKMDPDEFIKRMSESEMPKVPEKLEQVIAEFERKRKQLVAISAEIKLFDWTAAVTDPATLKSRERGERRTVAFKICANAISRASWRWIAGSAREASTKSCQQHQINKKRVIKSLEVKQRPLQGTLRITPKFYYFRCLYLECCEQPDLSLIVPYSYSSVYTFYEDQLIGMFYSILWGVHNGFKRIDVSIYHERICTYLRQSDPTIVGKHPIKKPELVKALMKMFQTKEEDLFQVQLGLRACKDPLYEKPPPGNKMSELRFLDTTRDISDLVQQVIERNPFEIPELQERNIREASTRKQFKDLREEGKKVENPNNSEIKPNWKNIQAKVVQKATKRSIIKTPSGDLVVVKSPLSIAKPKLEKPKIVPALPVKSPRDSEFIELYVEDQDNSDEEWGDSLRMRIDDDLDSQASRWRRRYLKSRFDRGDL
ncbi:unnamed protein product, partial [Mesorhabditis belari]|uniref:Uncharacterized protein n=1 Tax=Mesorhabditis belari TaxID=2138241 RepID=A0AAF3FH40_9BILA